LRAAETPRQPLGEIERARPADIVLRIRFHLRLEGRIVLRRGVGTLEFEHERHQRLGDEAAAIDAEVPARIGPEPHAVRARAHDTASRFLAPKAARADAMKAAIFFGSFSPGFFSTPDETSTASGRAVEIASATFSGVKPPESITGFWQMWRAISIQSNARPW